MLDYLLVLVYTVAEGRLLQVMLYCQLVEDVVEILIKYLGGFLIQGVLPSQRSIRLFVLGIFKLNVRGLFLQG